MRSIDPTLSLAQHNLVLFFGNCFRMTLKKLKLKLEKQLAWILLRDTCLGWVNDGAPRLGAALAFYSILSLVPLLLLFLSIASFFWGSQTAHGHITQQIVAIFGEHAAVAMQDVLNVTADAKDGGIIASILGFLTLAFSASGMFGELQSAMNIIWKVKPIGRPILTLLRDRLFSFLMVLSTGLILLISVMISAVASAAEIYIDNLIPTVHALTQVGDFLLSLAIISFLFALIFKIVPDVRISWRSAGPGGAFTALLFVIGKMLIGVYLGRTSVASTYGAAGSLVALLIWIYYSAQILFLGAEFTYAYSSHFKLQQNNIKSATHIPSKAR